MRKIIFSIVLIFCVINSKAQTDTTFYFEGNKIEVKKQDGELKVQVINDNIDSAEIVLFEGNYGDDFSSEVGFNFTFAKLEKKNKRKKLNPHHGGISWGFSSLASRDLNIANVENAKLQFSSYELGFHFGNFVVPMSRKHKVMFFTGIGLRFHRYNADYNTAFRIVDNYVQQVGAAEDIFYKTSKLTAWYITVPAMIEWQKKAGKRQFYIQGGLEGGLRFFSRSKVKFVEDGRKTKEKIGKKMNMNPVTLDAIVGIGYGPVGIYARYGLVSLFRAGRGPTVVPVAVGIQWNIRMEVGKKKGSETMVVKIM
jgi:hypothetical protein